MSPRHERRVSLPTYPFERRRYWLENDAGAQPRSSSSADMSSAGRRLRSALPETQFETVYSLARFDYLGDHRIYGMPILPFTAGLATLYDAARQHFGTDQVALANLQYREALVCRSPVNASCNPFWRRSTRRPRRSDWRASERTRPTPGERTWSAWRATGSRSQGDMAAHQPRSTRSSCGAPARFRPRSTTRRCGRSVFNMAPRSAPSRSSGAAQGEVLTRVRLPSQFPSKVRMPCTRPCSMLACTSIRR